MAYTDAQFNTQITLLASVAAGTATASATDGISATVQLFNTLRKVDISKIRVVNTTAPAANTTGLTFTVLAGTATVGTIATTTNSTAGLYTDATLVSSNTRVNADTKLSVVVTGTATASGQSYGAWLVEVAETPVFV